MIQFPAFGETDDDLGILHDRAANYRQTKKDAGRSYYTMSEAVMSVRCDCVDEIDLAKYLAEDENEQ